MTLGKRLRMITNKSTNTKPATDTKHAPPNPGRWEPFVIIKRGRSGPITTIRGKYLRNKNEQIFKMPLNIVFSAMVCLFDSYEVFRLIISLAAINMVHFLARRKHDAVGFFVYKTVFKDVSVLIGLMMARLIDSYIAMLVNKSSAFPSRAIRSLSVSMMPLNVFTKRKRMYITLGDYIPTTTGAKHRALVVFLYSALTFALMTANRFFVATKWGFTVNTGMHSYTSKVYLF